MQNEGGGAEIWLSKKFIVIAILAALPIIVLALIGGGCTQTGDSDSNQTEAETTSNEMPDRMQMQMPLDEVTEILGIDQQELENAFTQAREEIVDSGHLNPSGEQLSNNPLPDGSPPEGLPRGMEPPAGRQLPDEALIARMAEILNIDQQSLEDAFAQAQSTDSAQYQIASGRSSIVSKRLTLLYALLGVGILTVTIGSILLLLQSL